MVLDSKVRTIVALATPHGESYLSDSRFPMNVGDDKIAKVSEEVAGVSPFFFQHKIVWRTFKITHPDGTTEALNHFHYENWPDHGPPEGTLFHQLLRIVEAHHTDGSSPLLVHCGGGVGRAGTFVTAHSLRKDIRALLRQEKPQFVNIPRRLLDLRFQRRKLVGHTAQLVAIIDAVRDAVFDSYLTQPEHKTG